MRKKEISKILKKKEGNKKLQKQKERQIPTIEERNN